MSVPPDDYCASSHKVDLKRVFEEQPVNNSSRIDSVQLTYEIIFSLLSSALKEEYPIQKFQLELQLLCWQSQDYFQKVDSNERSRSSSTEILTAFCYISYSSLSKFESFVKSVVAVSNPNKDDFDLFLTCCWFLNKENICYILSDSNELAVSEKRKIVKKFLKHEIEEEKSDFHHLSFMLACSYELGALKLIQELEQKLNMLDDYELSKLIDSKSKCFNDNYYKLPLSYSLSLNEYKIYLKNLYDDENMINDKVINRDGSVYDRPRDPPGQRSHYIPPGDTHKESYRLSTFIKFPPDSPVNPRTLASVGFYYTGYKDRVKCFSCGLCVESWTVGDDVSSSRWHRNNCQMMLQEDSGNVPIGRLFPNFAGSNSRPSGQMTTEGSRTSSSYSAPNLGSAPRSGPRGTATAAGTVLKNIASRGSVHTNAPPLQQTARPVQPPQQLNPSYTGVELATIPSVHHEQLVRSLDLRREGDRLRTFDAWPQTNRTVHRADLARYGFFYLGNLDRVQCFSCGGVLRNWNYGDDVEREHSTHFPDCRMVRNVESQNIALSAGERPPVPVPIVMQEPPDPNESEREDLRNMFPCINPASAHMRNEAGRFDTFDDRWPANQVRATPRQICRAGFFFLGDRDRVKCWYCNGGLQNWDPDDEPWTEHAKWFPTCEFLLQRKGPDFVHRIVAMFPNLPRPNLRAPFDVPPRGRGNRNPSPPPPIIDPRIEMQRVEQQIAEAMNLPVVTAAIQMGFEEHLIRRIVKRKLQQGSPMYTSVAVLVDDLTALSNADSSASEDNGDNSMLVEPSLQSTDVKTPGSAVETRDPTAGGASSMSAGSLLSRGGQFQEGGPVNVMDTEYSLPEDISPSMEARIRELQDERKCKICLDKLADVVFVPCGHLCSCTSCAQALRKCPICRVKIEKAIRTYLS